MSQGRPLSLQWAKQSGLLPAGRATDDGAGLLIITQVQEADSGTYICTATAGKFVVSETKELVVGPGGGPWGGGVMEVEPEDAAASPGDTIYLTCRGRGAVLWERQGAALPPAAFQEGGVLTIPSASPAHSGIYVCRGGGEARQARVIVLGIGAPPAVTITPEQQTVGQGEDAELRCSASGSPRPAVTWSKVGEELSSPRIAVTGEVLRVRGAAVADRGMYLCTAESAGGSARASAILEVEPREAPRLEVYPQVTPAPPPRLSAGAANGERGRQCALPVPRRGRHPQPRPHLDQVSA